MRQHRFTVLLQLLLASPRKALENPSQPAVLQPALPSIMSIFKAPEPQVPLALYHRLDFCIKLTISAVIPTPSAVNSRFLQLNSRFLQSNLGYLVPRLLQLNSRFLQLNLSYLVPHQLLYLVLGLMLYLMNQCGPETSLERGVGAPPHPD